MTVQNQGVSASNGQLYTWVTASPDWAGSSFPGPGAALHVAVAMAPATPGSGGGVTDHGALTGLTDVADHAWAELAQRPLSAYTAASNDAALADARKCITTERGSSITLRIRLQSAIVWLADSLLGGINLGSGTLTLTAEAGVTLNGSLTVPQHGWWWAKRIASDIWQVFTGGTGGGGGVTDHGALSGLSDDDHPQYLVASGARPLSAAWDVGNQAIDDVKSISYDGEIDNLTNAIDWTTGALQKKLALASSPTLTFTAPPAFTPCQFRWTQDGTGGRVITWPAAVLWSGGIEPNWDLSPNAENVAGGYYDGTNYRLGALDDGAIRVVTESGTTRTCILSDGGAMIECTNATGCAVTIPPNASVAIRVGKTILFTQSGAAQVTLVAGAGVTLETSETLKTLKLYSVIGATKLATNRWRVFGERELA
jgi:hypothetical protein